MKNNYKKSLLLISAISFFIFFVKEVGAQNKYSFTNRLNVRISGGIASQNGANYDQLFMDGKTGPYGTAFLGYRFDEDSDVANYFGVFGSVVKISGKSIQQMDLDEVMPVSSNFTGGESLAHEVEGGFIFGDWFRLSAGAGRMQIPTVGAWQYNNYYTGTGGFLIGKKVLNFHATTTVLFGGDLTKTAVRVNAGVGFSFKFLKSRKQSS
jgi:hypothetical protein